VQTVFGDPEEDAHLSGLTLGKVIAAALVMSPGKRSNSLMA